MIKTLKIKNKVKLILSFGILAMSYKNKLPLPNPLEAV